MYEGLKNLEVPRAPKDGRARRIVRVALVALLSVAVLATGMGAYTYFKVKDNLKAGVIEQLREVVEVALPGEPLNILVIGSDSREGVTGADLRAGLGGPEEGQRADVILLLHIYEGGKKAAMVSIPRDLRAEIPGHGTQKINAALGYGGPKLMIRTIKKLTGIRVNHFLEVNFFGFRGIVNAVKGVPVVIDREIHDDKAKLDVPSAGCWVLDGNEALAYVRARYFDPTADIGRIQRQQGFLRALAKRVGSIGVLVNPSTLNRISKEVGGHFDYDPGLVEGATFGRARAIAAALATLDQRKLDFRIVPSYGALINGISYLIPREDEMDALFAALREDRPLPNVGKTSQSVPERADVTVQVYNATAKSGLASKHTNKLSKKGFTMLQASTSETKRTRTLIRYEAEDELKVDLVKRFYKGARLKRVTGDMAADVVILLGKDVLKKNSTAGEGPDEPSPSPTPELQCKELKS